MSELGNQYADSLRLGKSCANKEQKNLLVLEGFLELLECYQPLTDNVTEEDNCFTEKKMQKMLQNIDKKYNLCFAPIGTSYSE